jgi:hypothetical protein
MLALKPPVEFTIGEKPVSDGFAAACAFAPEGATCAFAMAARAMTAAKHVVV